MLSPDARAYGASSREIYTPERARDVISYYDNIAREATVALATTAASPHSRRRDVQSLGDLRMIQQAHGAMEYAQWRLDTLTCTHIHSRIYNVNMGLMALPEIPPRIFDRLSAMSALLDIELVKWALMPERKNGRGLASSPEYLRSIIAHALARLPLQPTIESVKDVAIQIAICGKLLIFRQHPRLDGLDPDGTFHSQFALDHSDELLALYFWLRELGLLVPHWPRLE